MRQNFDIETEDETNSNSKMSIFDLVGYAIESVFKPFKNLFTNKLSNNEIKSFVDYNPESNLNFNHKFNEKARSNSKSLKNIQKIKYNKKYLGIDLKELSLDMRPSNFYDKQKQRKIKRKLKKLRGSINRDVNHNKTVQNVKKYFVAKSLNSNYLDNFIFHDFVKKRIINPNLQELDLKKITNFINYLLSEANKKHNNKIKAANKKFVFNTVISVIMYYRAIFYYLHFLHNQNIDKKDLESSENAGKSYNIKGSDLLSINDVLMIETQKLTNNKQQNSKLEAILKKIRISGLTLDLLSKAEIFFLKNYFKDLFQVFKNNITNGSNVSYMID